MSVFDSVPTTPVVLRADQPFDEAQLAAVAFLARYSGRTLESYRAGLRQFFQWANSAGLPPLAATRAHIELYRAWMDERGLAAFDRRSAAVDGVRLLPLRPPRRPHQLQPGAAREATSCTPLHPAGGWTAASSPPSCTPPSASARFTPRWPSCWGRPGCGSAKRARQRRRSRAAVGDGSTGVCADASVHAAGDGLLIATILHQFRLGRRCAVDRPAPGSALGIPIPSRCAAGTPSPRPPASCGRWRASGACTT